MKGRRGAPLVDYRFVRENWGVLTLEEIGDRFGVSKQRIGQIGAELGLPRLRAMRRTAGHRAVAAGPRVMPAQLPMAKSDFITPPSRAQLMGRR